MINQKYAKAYVEVLELLKYLPYEEYKRIPNEKISFFEENKDKTFEFKIDPQIELENQQISLEANTIIIQLFEEYFASEKQKNILKSLLLQNQTDKNQSVNYNEIFKKNQNEKKVEQNIEEKQIIVYKENIFTKIKRMILNIFSTRK